MLDERHPDTITSLNNLALVYDRQGRYAEAEPLFAQALQLRREVLDERHPDTITSLNNLALVYDRQGRYAEAEPLYAQALALSREMLGADHPLTLQIHGNLVYLLAHQGRMAVALVELRRMAPQRLSRLGRELYGTADATLRHGLLNAEADFQNLVLSVALAENGPTANSPPPVLLAAPQPGAYLSVAEAGAFLGVNRSTIRRWCELIPAFGIRLLTERGEWLIDPAAALIVGVVRHRNKGRHPPGALVRGTKNSPAARRAYLRAVLLEVRRDTDEDALKFIASRQHVPDCIVQFANNLRKRVPPAAAVVQPGEARNGTR